MSTRDQQAEIAWQYGVAHFESGGLIEIEPVLDLASAERTIRECGPHEPRCHVVRRPAHVEWEPLTGVDEQAAPPTPEPTP